MRLHRRMVAAAGMVLATLASAFAVATTAAPASAACEEVRWRNYTNTAWRWAPGAYSTYTFGANTSGTFTLQYAVSATRSTAVEGSVGVSAGVLIADINAQFKVGAVNSVTITTSQTVSVNVLLKPYPQRVYYGIYSRRYLVESRRQLTNCQRVTDGYGWVTVYYRAIAVERA